MSRLTIEEAKELKERLESAILNMCWDFEKHTQTVITDIILHRVYSMGECSSPGTVSVGVSL